MSFFESIVVSLFCIATVFVVLACLFVFVKILSKVLSGLAAKSAPLSENAKTAVETAAIAAPAADAPDFTAGELKLINVDEKTAAMIMAIVSHESQIPLSELQFRSIKAVPKTEIQ
jgi:Na+-transporting methylmalonyl-CoA/oxaloacetate decarboxylase gamma subunit